jgi:hypothetical protein
MSNLPKEQDTDFNDFGYTAAKQRRTLLTRIVIFLTVIITTLLTHVIWEAKQTRNISNLVRDKIQECEAKHAQQMLEQDEKHATEVKELNARYTNLVLELYQELRNKDLKIDTTLRKLKNNGL